MGVAKRVGAWLCRQGVHDAGFYIHVDRWRDGDGYYCTIRRCKRCGGSHGTTSNRRYHE